MGFHSTCPGSKIFKDIKPDDVRCPHCGHEVEIWSDELITRCKHCQGLVSKQQGPSCVDWCRWAKECIGAQKYQRLQADLARLAECQAAEAEPQAEPELA